MSAIRNYVLGVCKINVLAGLTPPDLKQIEAQITFMGLNKTKKHRPRQAQPITPDILLDLVIYLDLTERKDLVFWGILVIGFFTFFRKSNLIPDSLKHFSEFKQLTRNNISFSKGLAVISVGWSKTIQFNQKNLDIPLPN